MPSIAVSAPLATSPRTIGCGKMPMPPSALAMSIIVRALLQRLSDFCAMRDASIASRIRPWIERRREMTHPHLTAADCDAFWRDGYVLKRGCFDAEETGLLRKAIELAEGIRANVVALGRSKGGSTELALWNHPGDRKSTRLNSSH